MRDYMLSFESCTTDMGVEEGMPDFTCERAEDLLPEFFIRGEDRLQSARSDLEPIVPGRYHHLGEPDVLSARKFLPYALPIYGIRHAVNNSSKDTHKSLQRWSWFWRRIKNFETLLVSQERRRRFIHTCVQNSPCHNLIWKLNKWSKTLYEDRWREVLSFCKKFDEVHDIFVECWNEDRFQNFVDKTPSAASMAEASTGRIGDGVSK